MSSEIAQGAHLQRTGQVRLALSLPLVSWIVRLAEFAVVFLASNVAVLGLGFLVPAQLADDYGRLTLVSALMYLVVGEAMGLNDIECQFSLKKSWSRVLSAWTVTAVFMLTLGFFLKVSDDFSRAWVGTFFFASATGLVLTRTGLTVLTRRMKRQGVFNERAAIYGAGTPGVRLCDYIKHHDKLTLTVAGVYDDRPPKQVDIPPLPIRGGIQELIADIREGLVDQVILALPWSADKRLREIVEQLAVTPVRIRLAPEVASYMFSQRPVVLLGELPVLTLFERPISGFDQAIKWLEDHLLGTVLLILGAPLMVAIAIAIKLDSRGPVFFKQKREGFNNRTIRVWKFRSMYVDRCQDGGIVQAKRQDPRVTRVGAVIRRTSLDELPQLFNVLGGSMSLVGPRPHAPSTRAGGRLFSEIVATYAARHNVKPGMTGWAQVCGLRGETTTEDDLQKRLQHDLHYVERWSIWFDLYILARTFGAVLLNKSVY